MAHRVDSLRCEGSDAIGAKRTCRERRERVDLTKMPSRPGELHPEPLTDPDLTLSRHPAADSDEVARAFRDDVARYSDMMSPGVRCLAGG